MGFQLVKPNKKISKTVKTVDAVEPGQAAKPLLVEDDEYEEPRWANIRDPDLRFPTPAAKDPPSPTSGKVPSKAYLVSCANKWSPPRKHFQITTVGGPGLARQLIFSPGYKSQRHAACSPPLTPPQPLLRQLPFTPEYQSQRHTAPSSPLPPPLSRIFPHDRPLKTGRNGHVYVHARSQEANWQQDPFTGMWMYVDYKNIMIETTESLQPYIGAIKAELEAKGWQTDARASIAPKRMGYDKPNPWRTFISFFSRDDAWQAFQYLHNRGRHGSIEFARVDYHKTFKTLFEKSQRIPRGGHQRAISA